MRLILLLLAAAATSPLLAAEPTEKPAPPATENASDPSEAAWKDFMEKAAKPGKLDSREAVVSFQRTLIAALSEFLEKYPDSPHATEARFGRADMQLMLLTAGFPENIDPAALEKELRSLAGAADTPAALKKQAGVRLILLKIHAGSAEDADRELTAFEKDFSLTSLPPMVLPLLAKKLESVNPERAGKLRADAEAIEKKREEEQAKAEAEANKRLNQPLDIKFTAVDGTEVDVQKMRGKVVLVDFWATWCGPCMAELPNVLATYKKYHDQGFEIVGISFDQDKEALLSVTKKEGMTWPQYFDGEGWGNKFGKEFGIDSIPRMWLVNKEGLLVDLNGRQDLEAKVAKLLEK